MIPWASETKAGYSRFSTTELKVGSGGEGGSWIHRQSTKKDIVYEF